MRRPNSSRRSSSQSARGALTQRGPCNVHTPRGWRIGQRRLCLAAVSSRDFEAKRFRAIFRRVHADHPRCLADEWLMEPCRLRGGELAPRPIVWSRRNGPWQRVAVLWVGAAPGNAGGMGSGAHGAHGTRIPFGGDVAGANLDALLGSVGLDRNQTFITAALNQLPAKGGGEPSPAELRAPVGAYSTSTHLLRDTILAAGPRLIVALGNVAARSIFAAVRVAEQDGRFPSLAALRSRGLERGVAHAFAAVLGADSPFEHEWAANWGVGNLPEVLWLTHPSAQNMSPFAADGTLFHLRMLEARDALRSAFRDRLRHKIPRNRPKLPETGIYALPEWRELIAPRHARLDRLWRERGI